MAWNRALAAAGLLLVAVGGCAHHASRPRVQVPSPPLAMLASTELPQVERLPATATEHLLPSVAEVEAVWGPLRAAESGYRELTADQTRCRAAETSNTARLLDEERRAMQAQFLSSDSDQQQRACAAHAMQQQLLADAAAVARNRDAQLALERFYRLAAAERNRDWAEASLQTLTETLKKSVQLLDQGLEVPVSLVVLQRQQLEIRSKHAELLRGRLQLNRQLTEQLRITPPDPPADLWPAVTWQPEVKAIDRAAQVAAAMAQHPELQLLRNLDARLNVHTLPVTRQALGQINALLGATMSSDSGLTGLCKLLEILHNSAGDNGADVTARRRQLREQLADREAAITREVHDAIDEIELRLRQIAWTGDRLTGWKQEIAAAEMRVATGQATFVDVTSAKLHRLEVEAELTEQLAGWYLAQVHLQAALGTLADCDTPLPEMLLPETPAEILPEDPPAVELRPASYRQIPTVSHRPGHVGPIRR